MCLADGDHCSLYVQHVFLDIIYTGEIDDIGPVYFHETKRIHLGLQVLYGIVRYILFFGSDELHIVAHTFNIQDIIVLQPDQFPVRLDENVIVVRCSVVFFFLLFYFLDRFKKSLVGKRLFQVVGNVILKSIISIFGF
jgi:hypothetical protein